MKKKKDLKSVFVSIIVFCTILVILIPLIISKSFYFLDEEWLEISLDLLLMIVIYSTHFFYFRKNKKMKIYQGNLEERLTETFRYIGSVNLQLEEFKKIFSNFKKYPENKKDVKYLLDYFCDKILSIIGADWVVLKIIELDSRKTIRYVVRSRAGQPLSGIKFENKDILSGNCSLDSCTIIGSDQENLNIKAFCVLPVKLKNRDERFFITSIINHLEMLFIIFSSLYYKNSREKSKGVKSLKI